MYNYFHQNINFNLCCIWFSVEHMCMYCVQIVQIFSFVKFTWLSTCSWNWMQTINESMNEWILWVTDWFHYCRYKKAHFFSFFFLFFFLFSFLCACAMLCSYFICVVSWFMQILKLYSHEKKYHLFNMISDWLCENIADTVNLLNSSVRIIYNDFLKSFSVVRENMLMWTSSFMKVWMMNYAMLEAEQSSDLYTY